MKDKEGRESVRKGEDQGRERVRKGKDQGREGG